MNTQEYREDGQVPVEHSPFDRPVEGEVFSQDGHRREILDGMLEAITAGVPILTLTGEDGSGKTMMCRMIEERMATGHVVVFFPQTIDSFEEVVRIVAQRLEIRAVAGGGITAGLLQSVISDIHNRNIHLLLIFDEAERIYLATLERVRKMLDLTNVSGVFMQIVLSGGIGLHNNFKHLALCNFQQVEERQFSLAAFTGDDTNESPGHASRDKKPEKPKRPGFINRQLVTRIFSAAPGSLRSDRSHARNAFQVPGQAKSVPVLTGDDNDDSAGHASHGERPEKPKRPSIINRQLATRIFSAAHGILQTIKSQARKAFQVLGAAISIPVLPKRTAGAGDTAIPRRRLKSPAFSLKRLTVNRRYLVWGSGIAGLVLVALLLLQLDRHNGELPVATSPETKDTIVISQPEAFERRSESTAVFSEEKKVEEEKEQERPVFSAESSGEDRQEQELPATSVAAVRPVTEPVEENPAAPLEVTQPVAPVRSVQQTAEVEKAPVAPVEPSQATAPEQNKAAAQTPAASSEAVQPAESVRGQSAPPARTAQVVEEDLETAEQRKERAPSLRPAVENVAETDGIRTSPQADQEKTIAPARVLEAREVVKQRDLLSSAPPVATIRDPARIAKSQEKTKISEIPIPARIKAERKEQPNPAAEPTPPTPQVPAEPKTITAKVIEKEPVPTRKEESVERVYDRRIAAGSTWLLGNKDDRYTIQLMVVTSGDAEKKVKDMLAQEEYRGQADKFYILRKESNPGVQYIYYGEYPTMTDARNARNTMPGFLRGHRPYALSVKGAVQKALEDE